MMISILSRRRQLGAEGTVSKRADSLYRHWCEPCLAEDQGQGAGAFVVTELAP